MKKYFSFASPSELTLSNPDKIEIVDGKLQLKEDKTKLYLRTNFNEESGITAYDSSGNNRSAILVGGASFVTGHLNNCLQTGVGKYADYGADVGGFKKDDVFGFFAWINTTYSGAVQTILGKRDFEKNGYILSLSSTGELEFRLGELINVNEIHVKTNTTLNDGGFHLVGFIYIGTSLASGVLLYADGSILTPTVITNNFTGTIINPRKFQVGVHHDNKQPFIGKIDEVVGLIDFIPDNDYITYMYNSGIGREYEPYHTDRPYAYYNSSFNESISKLNSLEVEYEENSPTDSYSVFQINDGDDWKYENGNDWVPALSSEYNTELEVNDKLDTFPLTGNINFKIILVSNGYEQVSVKWLGLDYALISIQPIVWAGSDKYVLANYPLKTFSDATATDNDGEIIRFYYKIPGLADDWLEIDPTGYANSLEAVHNFEYTFITPGTYQVFLQVEDNLNNKISDSIDVSVHEEIAHAVNKCTVKGHENRPDGTPIAGAIIRFYTYDSNHQRLSENINIGLDAPVISDAAGYWEIDLYETETYNKYLNVEITYPSDPDYRFWAQVMIPNLAEIKFSDLLLNYKP